MKSIKLSLISILIGSSFAIAGGDIISVTPYEIEDIEAASKEVIKETTPISTPKVVVPTPKKIIAPATPAVLPNANISPFYVGLGITAAQYKTGCNCRGTKSGTDKTLGGVARIGYDFNRYLGMEARAIVTPFKENGGKVQHYGAFLKPMYPVTDEVNVYALGGIAKTKTTGSLRKTDVSGLAFGVGLEYDISKDKKKEAKYNREFDGQADQERGFGIFADYERLYYKKGSPDLDAVSVGVTYDF